jgi:hypothetical protein
MPGTSWQWFSFKELEMFVPTSGHKELYTGISGQIFWPMVRSMILTPQDFSPAADRRAKSARPGFPAASLFWTLIAKIALNKR